MVVLHYNSVNEINTLYITVKWRRVQSYGCVHCVWQKTVSQSVHVKSGLATARLLFVPESTGYCWGSEAYCGKVKKRNLGNETFFSYSPHWKQLLHPFSRCSIKWCLWFNAIYDAEAHPFQGWDRPKHILIWFPGIDPHQRTERTMEVQAYKWYFFYYQEGASDRYHLCGEKPLCSSAWIILHLFKSESLLIDKF